MDVVQQIEQKIKNLLQDRRELRAQVANFNQQRASESQALTNLEQRVTQLQEHHDKLKANETHLQSVIEALEQEREQTKGQLQQLLRAFEELS